MTKNTTERSITVKKLIGTGILAVGLAGNISMVQAAQQMDNENTMDQNSQTTEMQSEAMNQKDTMEQRVKDVAGVTIDNLDQKANLELSNDQREEMIDAYTKYTLNSNRGSIREAGEATKEYSEDVVDILDDDQYQKMYRYQQIEQARRNQNVTNANQSENRMNQGETEMKQGDERMGLKSSEENENLN